jgi:xanthine dehydrogenase small subunit
MARDVIRFLRRGRIVEVKGTHPSATLLDWLRLGERSFGTKEGCAEGDCGACTVALGRVRGGRLVYEPVNACILLLGQADGSEVVTVEDLATAGRLHPVQAAMAARHGSQCGFCTPGIVMSLFALYQEGDRPVSRAAVNDALAGNLCRCTGYRPIVDAALEACAEEPVDGFTVRKDETASRLAGMVNRDEDLFVGTPTRFFAAPASEESLVELCTAHPDATLLAGATDVGLWITKNFQVLDKVIWLGRVKGLDRIEDTLDGLAIGATVSHARAMPRLAAIDPDLGELMRRFGSEQIRVSGTVGGNIANGSPIGDLAPALIALGAQLELHSAAGIRTIPLEAFFLAYRKQDRQPGEFVRRLVVPRPRPDQHLRVFKISKRFDEDISAVMAAFCLTVADGLVSEARVAYGGMAGTPKRAAHLEHALTGMRVSEGAAWQAASEALENDFTPLGDQRATAAYRMRVAKNLVLKAMAEIAGAPTLATRVAGQREAAGVAAQ